MLERFALGMDSQSHDEATLVWIICSSSYLAFLVTASVSPCSMRLLADKAPVIFNFIQMTSWTGPAPADFIIYSMRLVAT